MLCKKVFLEILQNSQENFITKDFIKKETLAQVFSCEFCEISKNTFFHRTPLVSASRFDMVLNTALREHLRQLKIFDVN